MILQYLIILLCIVKVNLFLHFLRRQNFAAVNPDRNGIYGGIAECRRKFRGLLPYYINFTLCIVNNYGHVRRISITLYIIPWQCMNYFCHFIFCSCQFCFIGYVSGEYRCDTTIGKGSFTEQIPLDGVMTDEECVDECVKKKETDDVINGVSYSPIEGSVNVTCYCDKGWQSADDSITNFQTCILLPKGKLFSTLMLFFLRIIYSRFVI